MVKKLEINNETIYFEKDDKYKTISISMYMFNPFTSVHASERKILASILSKSNKIYPNEQDFNIHCQELYDLSFRVRNSRIARTSVFGANVGIISPSYIKEENNLFNDALNTLITGIYYPDITADKVSIEKTILTNELNNVYNKKTQYAIQTFNKHMFEGELAGISVNGTTEDVEKVTLKSVKDTYREIIMYPRIFYINGNLEEEEIINFFKDINLPKVSKGLSFLEFLDKETKTIEKVKTITEVQNLSQSILCMGYRSNILYDNDLYVAMHLFCCMLGGFFHSTLFQVIREEHSLAYSISSDYNIRKGNMTILAGIDKDSYESVITMINQIIEDYRNGHIEEEVLELTKKCVINNTIDSEDDVSTSLFKIYNELVNLPNYTLEEKVNNINNVTINDIIKVAKMVELDTIYFLKGDNNEED